MSTDHSINESQRIRLFYDPNSLSNFNKYRIIHTYFDLTVDFDSSILDGYVQLYIKQLDNKLCDYSSSITTENKEIPNDHGNKLILDSHHLNIEKVLLKINNSEKELRYEIDKERELLTIEMNEISNDSIISVFIYYSTSNTKCIALKWLKKEQTTDKQYPYMFSQCQAIHARSLYPCQDTPGVKSTFTAKIACPKPLTVLMSGLQRKHDENTNTFYFEQNQAIPSYLVAIAVGHLVSYDLSPRIRLWTEPSMIKQCQYEFKDAEQFLTTAEQLLGEYKWKRYDFLVLPLSVPYIRMENPCMNFLSPTLLADHHSLRSTIVHEMTHSWTGNLVTHENWEHFWLNEGFTSFIEAKILGNLAKRNGNEVRRLHAAQQWQDFKNAIDTLGSTQPYTCLVYRLNNIDPDVVYACGSVQCYKGVALWHLEQNIIGSESKFEEFIRSYSIKFGGKNLNTDDFIQYFKSYFPQASSVDWQSWIYTLGMPPITHDYSTQLEQQCHKLANQQTSITQQQIESFNVEQIAYILNLLLNQKSSIIYDKIKQLDVDCNISKYSNWNIRILWYQLCIRVKYYDVLGDLFKFLEINGCTKFVKLLYAEFKSSWPNMMLKAEKFFQEHERIESSMQMKILIDLLDSIREISQSFNIRKKRSKYAQVVESLKESITHLIKQIKNSEITMVEIRKQYISIIENMNIEIDRLGQVVEGQQNPQMKRDFESIKLNFQVEKDKQSILKTSKPHVGEIYKIRVGLESRLEEFLSTMSETNSSSSSSTSASTSLSSRKQKGQSQGRRRPCLIWNTENEGIEVLPIASFGGKDLAKIKTDIQCTISSKDFFNYVLSIHPIASPPNKRSLRPKIIKSMSKPLTGYLILMPIVISDSTPLHGPMPVVFEKNDMLYINNKLDALIKEKQDKIIENIDYSKIIANTQYDDDDSSSQETAHSIPNARSCLFEINHFDKNNLTENWLSKYDDDIKMHNEWQYIDDLAYKDSIEWNPENDDQLNEASVDLYLYPVLHITNLLPIDIQCLFDLNFQVEKDKQSILKTSKPHVGEIYKIRVGLESRLEEFLSTMSETNSSSSSSTSASTSLSSRKQKGQSQGRRRPCLIWNTENEGIEVLPIASFGGKDLAKIKTDIQCTISSKDFFNYVLSIHPIASPPNKRSLRPKIIKSMSKPLTGYLILMPIVISDSTPLHGPMPVVFEKNDMLYINNKLDALIKEKQDKIIENIDYSKIIANTQYDDDDSSSQETAHSIPNARSCLFEINHFDKNNLIENWLSKYDDDIKMHNEWQYIDDLAYKDSIEWNPENDDQLNEASVDLYLYPVLHITNLLPIDIQCLFDSVEQVDLKPSQLNEIAFGDKYSTLIFMIPSYQKSEFIFI
ncbi:unnamed protein product [Rotaria socialis]